MKANFFRGILVYAFLLLPLLASEPESALIKPAKSLGTGLPLLPDLDLSKFSREEFIRLSSSVGTNLIRKEWTSPVVTLPPHPRSNVHGLTVDEVKSCMSIVRELFRDGKANPLSDVGLVSTQEDVIRRPMLNHIAAFSNAVARAYLLVQKTSTDQGWGFFAIVQDLTVDPPLDYFADMNGKEIKFEGHECYKCHSSGPLAIHPARQDLVMDAELAAAIGRHIARGPLSNYYWPASEKKRDYGAPLDLEFCTKCHEADGVRQPLYRVHSHPIRIYVDYGYMPPKHLLTEAHVAELKAWLEQKP
ncbi:MAG TPA: hypothetical protein VK633_09555 [Verrucomicrobiae bacterium]|nr:hypothetical protein [Verrucomicrobiae bacterium]